MRGDVCVERESGEGGCKVGCRGLSLALWVWVSYPPHIHQVHPHLRGAFNPHPPVRRIRSLAIVITFRSCSDLFKWRSVYRQVFIFAWDLRTHPLWASMGVLPWKSTGTHNFARMLQTIFACVFPCTASLLLSSPFQWVCLVEGRKGTRRGWAARFIFGHVVTAKNKGWGLGS